MSSRNMRLLPWAALRSDSEQVNSWKPIASKKPTENRIPAENSGKIKESIDTTFDPP
jgi:hypothetical protein